MKFTIIITSEGRKDFLTKAMKSVVDQTLDRKFFEILLIKNFFDVEIEEFCKLNNIRCLEKPSRELLRSVIFNINYINGDYVCFLDDDDMYNTDKLERLYRIFEVNTKITYYHHSQIFIDENDNELEYSRFPNIYGKFELNSLNLQRSQLRRFLEVGGDFNNSSICISSRILKDSKEAINLSSGGTDSFLFYAALAFEGIIVHDPITLTKYRVHTSTSNSLDPRSIEIPAMLSFYERAIIGLTAVHKLTLPKIAESFLNDDIRNYKARFDILSSMNKYKIKYSEFILLQLRVILNGKKYSLIISILYILFLINPQLSKKMYLANKYTKPKKFEVSVS